jgi:hypothetical protein
LEELNTEDCISDNDMIGDIDADPKMYRHEPHVWRIDMKMRNGHAGNDAVVRDGSSGRDIGDANTSTGASGKGHSGENDLIPSVALLDQVLMFASCSVCSAEHTSRDSSSPIHGSSKFCPLFLLH